MAKHRIMSISIQPRCLRKKYTSPFGPWFIELPLGVQRWRVDVSRRALPNGGFLSTPKGATLLRAPAAEVANFRRDENIERLAERFALEDSAKCRLVELRVRRKNLLEQDLARLAEHLELSSEPSFTAVSLVKKVVQGRLAELPPLEEAKTLAAAFGLEGSACFKLRDLVEKRAEDLDVVLKQLKQVLEVARNPNATFLKVLDTYLAGGLLEPGAIEVIRLESKQQARLEAAQMKAQKQKKKNKKKSSSSSDSSSSGKKKKAKKVKKKGKDKKAKKEKKAKDSS
ncbi:unnamed protein product [Effrenium voratum]|nr:unnamed protein product [Effrenium voratum]